MDSRVRGTAIVDEADLLRRSCRKSREDPVRQNTRAVTFNVTQNWHGSNISLTYNPSHRSGKFTQMQKCILVACPPKITARIRGNPTKASSVNRDLTPKILPPCKTLHYICEHMTSTTTLQKTILNHNYVEFATCEQNFSPMNSAGESASAWQRR